MGYFLGEMRKIFLVKYNFFFVKAFSMDSILSEKIGQEEVVFNKEDFPHISKEILQEAAKPLARKYLDILIGYPNLALQTVCETGFGCQDCAKGRCLYRSKFGSVETPAFCTILTTESS